MKTVLFHRFLAWVCVGVMLCSGVRAEGAESLDSVLTTLVREIENLPQYSSSKEDRLGALRTVYFESDGAASSFKTAKELFDEYIYYQSDSAYVYASRMKSLAEQMNDPGKLALSYLALMKCSAHIANPIFPYPSKSSI